MIALKGRNEYSAKEERAVVVAQLAERSLPTSEIRGSNHDIGNISNVFICQLLSRKDENKEKEAEKGPLKKYIKEESLNVTYSILFST